MSIQRQGARAVQQLDLILDAADPIAPREHLGMNSIVLLVRGEGLFFTTIFLKDACVSRGALHEMHKKCEEYCQCLCQ